MSALYIPLGPESEVKVELTLCFPRLLGRDSGVEEREPSFSELVAAFRALRESDLATMVSSQFADLRGEVATPPHGVSGKCPSPASARVLVGRVSDSGQVTTQGGGDGLESIFDPLVIGEEADS